MQSQSYSLPYVSEWRAIGSDCIAAPFRFRNAAGVSSSVPSSRLRRQTAARHGPTRTKEHQKFRTSITDTVTYFWPCPVPLAAVTIPQRRVFHSHFHLGVGTKTGIIEPMKVPSDMRSIIRNIYIGFVYCTSVCCTRPSMVHGEGTLCCMFTYNMYGQASFRLSSAAMYIHTKHLVFSSPLWKTHSSVQHNSTTE